MIHTGYNILIIIISNKKVRYNMSLPYDDSNAKDIEDYAKALIGRTFQEVYELNLSHIKKDLDTYLSGARKGGLGNLIEEQYFCYEANSSPEADFPKAGLELKVTPYEKNKNGTIKAGERLVLGMISYDSPIEDDFYRSHAWEKCKLILLIYYLRNKSLASKKLYRIDYVKLFTPPKTDLAIILNDYKVISDKIKAGIAHELSESDTMYLGACTKGANAEKSTVPQYYGKHELARKRAFCFKTSYMTYILNHYVVKNVTLVEAIVDDANLLMKKSFAEIVQDKFNEYKGKTDEYIAEKFGVVFNKKSYWISLAYRILGIKANRAEEFEKANITVKAIRIEPNGKMKETSPLPTFKFKDLVRENDWEESTIYKYLDENKFLFVVFKKLSESDKHYTLMGCQLWNMPHTDLNTHVFKCWEKTIDILKNGVVFNKKYISNKVIIENNLPGISDNGVIHIRPHAKNTYYEFEDGSIFGKGKRNEDGDELPDGRWMTRQSFFFNGTYIVSQLRDELK